MTISQNRSAASVSIRRPHAEPVQTFTGEDVAEAYHYPHQFTGKGITVGLIELGGGFGTTDLDVYFKANLLKRPRTTAICVAGAKNSSDGPNGADGEVYLDIEVLGAVAPDADIRVYIASNTDDGFFEAIRLAGEECDIISISWGGPENAWDENTMLAFDALFAGLRKKGVIVFAAAGDTGSQDSGGDGKDHVDFPASSPNVVGCGGTELRVDGHLNRVSEVVWDLNDRSSATGGGVSTIFPGRQVPDVAGNASPATGYRVRVDGGDYVIGGTSAVAPLYAGLAARLLEARGGKPFDFLNTVVTNPQVCFDVTEGDNGGYRAGPGRDLNTGFGVVDGEKMLAVLTDTIPDPAPPAPTPPVQLSSLGKFVAAAQKWAEATKDNRHIRHVDIDLLNAFETYYDEALNRP